MEEWDGWTPVAGFGSSVADFRRWLAGLPGMAEAGSSWLVEQENVLDVVAKLGRHGHFQVLK